MWRETWHIWIWIFCVHISMDMWTQKILTGLGRNNTTIDVMSPSRHQTFNHMEVHIISSRHYRTFSFHNFVAHDALQVASPEQSWLVGVDVWWERGSLSRPRLAAATAVGSCTYTPPPHVGVIRCENTQTCPTHTQRQGEKLTKWTNELAQVSNISWPQVSSIAVRCTRVISHSMSRFVKYWSDLVSFYNVITR